MLKLQSSSVSLDDENYSGHTLWGDGVTFHFRNGLDVFVSKEIGERITSALSHLNKLECGRHGNPAPAKKDGETKA